MRRRPLVAVCLGVPLVIALALPLARRRSASAQTAPSPVAAEPVAAEPIAAVAAVMTAAKPTPTLAGLDLTKIDVRDRGVTAPLPERRVARLSVDPALQRAAYRTMAASRMPEAAVVVMDVETGKVIVYASHVEKGSKRDLAVEARAPAASVFKIVTATALVETAGAAADQRECYSGGEHRIGAQDLVPDPKRDRWCTTLAGAMGRSINTVFARLAVAKLEPAQLEATARTLGFGAPLPFDVPVEPSALHIPEEQLAYGRTAAGFWNTTLSPLHGAWLGAAVARGGEPVRPSLVTEVLEDGKPVWTAPTSVAQRRVMSAETARAVTTMMESTVSDGTSFKAFRDRRGRAFLPGVSVAGKTGTLSDPSTQRLYTWFAGFAPSKPIALPESAQKDGHGGQQPRKVAFGVLVVNEPKWTMKANVLAREVLRAYFAGQGVPGVSVPGERSNQSRAGGAPAASTTPATKHRRHRGS